ncbi:hypothetical protein BO94DRAFT_576657 [Aspergillus sclerotioniger CBS 115572]|uniref:NAD(P)-binding domain-containing protein n=1 Tax=Aspergillus sclerotioniger CBS 115572 TaxID=1450535 RepID=A0A317W594_9EURO|nr:hypothetical protein BO94DRAFT_576657 [Aspergillus sclerotioniger CBS 115572]PWY81734.1 hypothetical protein BO94DRAFT_576657 [Aspergillus sclerotioniger CBS 115572]
MPPKPTIAFFGATGGSVLSCLIPALKAGHKCNALVRTPTKLLTLLTKHNISSSLIEQNLTIIPGPATSLPAVTQTLLLINPNSTPESIPVDLIITGIGGTLIFNLPNPFPTLDNPTVCTDTMRTILTAARTLPRKPKLVVVTGTGIHYTKRDVPVLMIPLYHWLLGVPHADKRVMEDLVVGEMERDVDGEDGKGKGISGFLFVRASLLVDGGFEGRMGMGMGMGWRGKGGRDGGAGGGGCG